MKRSITSLVPLSFVLLLQMLSAQSGNITGHSMRNGTYILTLDIAAVEMTFYTSEIVRIDARPGPSSAIDPSFVVHQQPDRNVSVSMAENDSMIVFRTDRLRIECWKFPFRIMVYNDKGRKILEQPALDGFLPVGQSRRVSFRIDAKDHFYGTGERGTELDKRGERFVSYNTQIGGYSEPLATMNLNVPFVANPDGYALYIDNTYRGVFDFGKNDSTLFTYEAEGGEISLYVIAAETIPEQLERYTWLTGRQPLPPRWAFGFIQSKNRYVDARETRGIIREMRERDFPLDAIVLDLAWFRHMGDISWDEAAWPDHERMVDEFLSEGIRTILITEPYIIQPSQNFAEADSLGFLAKGKDGKTQFLEKWWSCGGCNSTLLDLTNPAAQQWWWKKHPEAFGRTVAGIWTDLGEPEKHPESMQHALGSTVKIHNIFNLLWAKVIYDGFTSIRPNERVVNLTRSGFAGIQRYGVIPWSGDVARSFGGLSVQLPMLLNMGMSGLAYQNSDIGGYARNPTTAELYVRWMQFGIFCGMTRAHGAGEVVKGSPTEPWMFGKQAETINRKYLNLRYQLLPYNYSLAYQNYRTGIPFARPLFWMEPENELLLNESSTFMWGDALLVSPVVEAGQTKKEVVLPAGNWIDYWTDASVTGGRKVTVDAPLEKIPLFVKSGSIVPMAPVMRYSDERPLDTLLVHVYPDPRSGSTTGFVMYEDDGTSREYQHGKFMTTVFRQKWDSSAGGNRLQISAAPDGGSYNGQPLRRNYLFTLHQQQVLPKAITVAGRELHLRGSYSDLRKSDRSYYYDRKERMLHLLVNAAAAETVEVKIEFSK